MNQPTIGFGTYRLEGPECESMVELALERGVRYLDTAKLYGNQTQVGRALARFLSKHPSVNRSDIIVSSKVTWRSIKKLRIEKDVVKILNELGTYVDVLLLHAPVGDERAIQASWMMMEDIFHRYRNRIRAIGVSNYEVHHLESTLRIAKIRPDVNQFEVSPFWTRVELVEFCRNNGIDVVAHSSLTKGHKFNDKTVVSLARKYQCSSAQILLRWALQKRFIVIPKSSRVEHLDENLQPHNNWLSTEDMTILDGLDERFATHPQYCYDHQSSFHGPHEQPVNNVVVSPTCDTSDVDLFQFEFVEGLVCGCG